MSELQSEYELSVLRAFYDAWEALHAMPKDNMHRKKQEIAAQNLVDARNAVRTFDGPSIITNLLNS